MTTFNLTCEAVETMLHEYLDETLEPWARISVEEHLRECARCTALARELRNISREAAALPALLPEIDPWPRVADRIGVPAIESAPMAEVAPLTPAPEPIVSASDAPLPISEWPAVADAPLPTSVRPAVADAPLPISEWAAVAIERPVPTAEPEVVTSEPPMSIGDAPMRMGEPPVLRSEEPPALKSDGPPVLAIPVYVLPPVVSPPKEESVSQPSEPVPPSRAPRVPKTAPLHAHLGRRREKRWRPQWAGLAAAALVLVTAGATFLLTKQWLGPARSSNVASDTGKRTKMAPGEPGTRGPAAGPEQVASGSSTTPPPGQLGSAVTVSAASTAQFVPSPEEVVYDKEIKTLQRIVRRQNAGLDASTVAEIDKNLRTLDAAIAQIRAALQKDPGSSLLDGQASRALEMKVELLRRAAMLRSST